MVLVCVRMVLVCENGTGVREWYWCVRMVLV